MKYVIAGIIILAALILDLFFSEGRNDGTPTKLIGIDADLGEIIDTTCNYELVPVVIGTGGGYGGSHSVLDKARLDDHNDYEPE